MKKKCLNCDSEVRGRSDKKFCSSQCRNDYYNRLNRDENSYINAINRLLRRNRRILVRFYEQKQTRINKIRMIAAGFDFNFFTNVFKTKKGREYMYCYDFGYYFADDEVVHIVKKEDYVDGYVADE